MPWVTINGTHVLVGEPTKQDVSPARKTKLTEAERMQEEVHSAERQNLQKRLRKTLQIAHSRGLSHDEVRQHVMGILEEFKPRETERPKEMANRKAAAQAARGKRYS